MKGNIFPLSKELAAQKLHDDRRIVEAKRLIMEAVRDHQKSIKTVKPPLDSLKQSYKDMLNSMAAFRGGKLWFPFIGSGIGNGCLVELADGSVKYDFISGIGVHFLGHSHPNLIEAGVDAAIGDTIMQGHLQQNVESLRLSKLLTEAAGLPHCFLTTSGVMANENALKIAFQKRFPASRVLAFEHCFAGRTLAISQITDKPAYREGLPRNLFVDYVPYYDSMHPRESTDLAVETLKKHIARYPKEHALMIFEFVQGEAGFYTGTENFFRALGDVLKENQIAIFADEVQSFGRTEELFAFQYFNLQKYIDMVSIGKLSQVCATFFTDEYNPRPGLLSQTFTGSTSAIIGSLAILNELIHGGYYGPEGKIHKIHHYFVNKLETLSKKHPYLIQGPFGTGCMIAFTPNEGNGQKTMEFVQRLFTAGVMGFTAGSNPTRVRFLIPAGAITYEDIDKAMEIIETTLLQPA